MIGDAVLDVVFGVATWLVGLFPENTVDISLPSGAQGLMSWVGEIVNLSAFAAAAAVIVAGETALLTARGMLFVWRLIRG